MAPRPVFLHGSGGGTYTWVGQEPRFEGCYVLALPGHPAGTPLRSVGGNAEWLAHSLREIPGPNVLVGHSLGGAIAMHLSLIAPELVQGLVLISTSACFGLPDGLPEAARTDVAHAADRLIARGWPGIDEATRASEAALIVENGSETLARDYEAAATFDLTDRLQEISVPTLVVVGSDDVIAPPSHADVLAMGIAGATLIQIPGVGHFPMREAPDTVSLLVAGFLAHIEVAADG